MKKAEIDGSQSFRVTCCKQRPRRRSSASRNKKTSRPPETQPCVWQAPPSSDASSAAAAQGEQPRPLTLALNVSSSRAPSSSTPTPMEDGCAAPPPYYSESLSMLSIPFSPLRFCRPNTRAFIPVSALQTVLSDRKKKKHQ